MAQIQPYVPRIPVWRDLPEGYNPDNPDENMVVKAEDVNAWQARLALLTTKANELDSTISSATSGAEVLAQAQSRGTQLVNNGNKWVSANDGNRGQVLTPDASSPNGYGWLRPHPNGLYTGEEITLTPTPTVQITVWGKQNTGTGYGGEIEMATPYKSPTDNYYQRVDWFPFQLTKSPDGWVYATTSGIILRSGNRNAQFSNGLTRFNFGTILPPAYRPPTDIVVEPGRFGVETGQSFNSNPSMLGSLFGYASMINQMTFQRDTSSDKDSMDYYNPKRGENIIQATKVVVTATGQLHICAYTIGNSGYYGGFNIVLATNQGVKLWKAVA